MSYIIKPQLFNDMLKILLHFQNSYSSIPPLIIKECQKILSDALICQKKEFFDILLIKNPDILDYFPESKVFFALKEEDFID